MNIFVPNSWLKEHLITKASIDVIAEYLSSCSQSAERIHKTDDDSIYEIEVTTNRPDCLSVFGIARELSAILPHFNIDAKLSPLPSSTINIPKINNSLPLEVSISDESLCPRFTAIIFDNISISPSPKIVQERLEKCGIRALNNVVDISNYLMLELGQPMHTFDYDKINKNIMILRESKKGESVITLDGHNRKLPKGAIIIEDGRKKIIDLCGIMGGELSAVDQNTKRVLLFVQTYDSVRIRKTCQALGFRTDASSRFEKGVEPEGVIPAIKSAIQMFKDNCGANIASNLIDIYPHPTTKKTVTLLYEKLIKILGKTIDLNDCVDILEKLGFQTSVKNRNTISAVVPHWRSGDISIPEDLIEEVARVSGYFNIPPVMLQGSIPLGSANYDYQFTDKIKLALKYWGFSEIHSYSLIGKNDLELMGLDPTLFTKVSNPISEDWVYLRPTLIPSMLKAVIKNQNEFPNFSLFEIANIYLSQGNNKLPEEVPYLIGLITESDFYKIKGIIESLLTDLGIENYEFKIKDDNLNQSNWIFVKSASADLLIENQYIGTLGSIDKSFLDKFGIKKGCLLFNLNKQKLVSLATNFRKYVSIPKNPPIIENLALIIPEQMQVASIINHIKTQSNLVYDVQLIDSFSQTKTFKITYLSKDRTLNNNEVKELRGKILQSLKNTLGVTMKTL